MWSLINAASLENKIYFQSEVIAMYPVKKYFQQNKFQQITPIHGQSPNWTYSSERRKYHWSFLEYPEDKGGSTLLTFVCQ